MKLYKKENIDLLNYLLIKKGKNPILRNYKLIIKDLGCNASCPMCDDWKNKGKSTGIKKNLINALKNILKDNIKFKRISILGGEPTLIIDDIINIIKIFSKYGMKFSFPTNASLLNIEKINKLINSGLDHFTFSIDFPDNYHDEWRKLPGTFNKILEFTKYIKEKGIEIQWNTVVGKFNYYKIKKFSELYKLEKPDIHNFILIEDTGGISKINLLNEDEIEKINNILDVLNSENLDMDFLKNGFNKNHDLENKLCFVPIKTISYQISEDNFYLSPCYIDKDKKFDDIGEFIHDAITKGCNKCNSSYKINYNNYMLDLIKKYNKK